jgi:hypothetical protein
MNNPSPKQSASMISTAGLDTELNPSDVNNGNVIKGSISNQRKDDIESIMLFHNEKLSNPMF